MMLFLAMDTNRGTLLPSPEALLVPLLVVGALVVLNGVFVAAEFAIIAIRPTQAEQMSQAGHLAAKRVFDILESQQRKDSYIATAQLGITLASLGLGMYGEPKVAHFVEPYLALILGVSPSSTLVHSVSYLIALSILTYLHVVIGEMMPKSWALAAPKQAVLSVSGLMKIAQALFAIPVRILNATGFLPDSRVRMHEWLRRSFFCRLVHWPPGK